MSIRHTKEEILSILAEARERWETPNLSGMDLSRMDLAGVDLSYTQLTGAILREANLSGADLRGASLHGADLSEANLPATNLRSVDLSDATLSWANLSGANLYYADLTGVDLIGASLRGANLYGVGQILRVDNLPSGQATLTPTTGGWVLTVGCWRGTVNGLRELIAGDIWPEAEGEEQARRRPSLELLIDMCEVHISYWPDLIDELKEKWGK